MLVQLVFVYNGGALWWWPSVVPFGGGGALRWWPSVVAFGGDLQWWPLVVAFGGGLRSVVLPTCHVLYISSSV